MHHLEILFIVTRSSVGSPNININVISMEMLVHEIVFISVMDQKIFSISTQNMSIVLHEFKSRSEFNINYLSA